MPIITVCIATYKRPQMLQNALNSIANLAIPDNYKVITIVVDNDKTGTARDVIEQQAGFHNDTLYYFIEPERGLSSVRNRLLDEAMKNNANFIAFIDDDEFVHPDWLINLLQTLTEYKVDIATGPVIGVTGTTPPKQVKVKRETGTIPRYVATNNVLFKSDLIKNGLKFDPYFNFIGSEDQDFFHRAGEQGFSRIWCAEALVYEIGSPERSTHKYHVYRSYSGGITNVLFYRKRTNASLPLTWLHFLIKSAGKLLGSFIFILAYCLTFKQKYRIKSIAMSATAAGYIAGLFNIVSECYRY